MRLIAKLENNKIVEIVRTVETVAFSPQPNWILVDFEPHLPVHKRKNTRWLPAETTRFIWVREVHF
jgi:hypothetical protein